jgi:hypothetical protein
MPDNYMDDIWKDKLGNYQAPADPQDWADMAAMLDAKADKRAAFYWWWLVAAALVVTVGGGMFHLMNVEANQLDAFAINGNGNAENSSNNNTFNSGSIAESGNTNANIHTPGNPKKSASGVLGHDNNSLNNTHTNTDGKGANKLNSNIAANKKPANGKNSNRPATKKGKQGKAGKGNKNGSLTNTDNSDNISGNGNNIANKGDANNRTSSHGTSNKAIVDGTAAADNYEKPGGTISVKHLKELPNPLALSVSRDTIMRNWRDKVLRPKAVQHYLGLSVGWVTARVDRSGDFRPGYNVGLQYSMMVKHRAGFHVGLAFRLYQYYTDLVACNYELYQCPNSYSSALQTIDLNVGAQVNLVKTDKVEWYVMAGVNNQFMLSETFEYNLPKIDTVSPTPIPVEPPTNTSFTGGGVSNYNESLDVSADFNSLTSNGAGSASGKFLRERYLGAWYVGTGITWHFASRMNLQVEPVIGSTMQFVGIQDKKMWNSGVNVRLNVRLGKF